jgi:starch synthase
MKTLFVSSEIFPFAKSGGLGDVAASLPKALNNYVETLSIMPLYGSIDQKKHDIQSTGFDYQFWVNGVEYGFEVYQSGKTLFLKESSGLFDREEMYGSYDDNDIRFGVFCYAVLEYIKASNQYFEIIHINDWQSALIALLEKELYHFGSKVIFTIHNLAYQGIFSKESINRLDLSWDVFTASKLEYHDQINLLKSAINYSDVVTTVSPTYASEIQTHRFGCDLENLIQDNAYKLRGILNGIDYDEFNPAIDTNLPKNYDPDNLTNKQAIKEELLEELYLKYANKPLFVFIGRFTAQKGIDQILDSIHELSKLPINIAILGSGEEKYNNWFGSLSGKYENISITIGYDEKLARKLYASADFLYMPSEYEPCGLNQMISMKYGAIPIVRSVGGLKDSVIDFETLSSYPNDKGVGITFEHGDQTAFIYVTNKALSLYNDKEKFKSIVSHDMRVDFSWDVKSREYLELYNDLASGWLPERKIKEFPIPTHYGVDTLKAIPINPTTLYTYWEITNDLLKKHQVSISQLKVKAYVDEIEVDEGDVYDGVGNYYFYPEMDFKSIKTRIGYTLEYGLFVTILESNKFIAPNSKIIKSNNILYRDIKRDEATIKNAKYLNFEYQEYDTLSSSAVARKRGIQQLQKLRHLSQKNDDQSSTILSKKGGL